MADAGGIDRTSAIGLFNTARSYWQSGVKLQALALKDITHPEAPVTFLLCHSLELYLKAFLRAAGRDLGFLKKIGHRVSDLAEVAVTDGLSIEPADIEVLSHIEDADVAMEARYIVTGFKQVPTNLALAESAERLDKSVGESLRKHGITIREQSFDPPPPSSDEFEPDTLRVLVRLFGASDIDERGNYAMASALQMELPMLQYHLECLQAADFADIGSASGMTGETYWYLTPQGRRYVVQRKLFGK